MSPFDHNAVERAVEDRADIEFLRFQERGLWASVQKETECENSPSLLVSVAESSEESFLDGKPSAPLKSMNTVGGFSCSAKMMDAWSRFQSGETSEPLTACRGVALSMSSAEGSPARTSAMQDIGPVSRVLDQGCGLKCSGSFARFDQDTCSWRTSQLCLSGEWAEFSETWPRQGTWDDTAAWELQTLAETTSESEFGFLPTPRASMTARFYSRKNLKGRTMANNLEERLAQMHPEHIGKPINLDWLDWLMRYPVSWSNAFEPLGMDKIHSWLQAHGAFSEAL